jgi:ketosteroid isomerase-like protein
MAGLSDISIERACERLVLDFAYFSDRAQYDALAALFTPDGTMMRPAGDTLVGRDAILKSYQARPAGRMTRHFCTNIRITVDSLDRAHGLTYAVVYSADAVRPPEAHFGIKADPRHLVGEFEDEFVRTEEGWRIASRRARFVMNSGSA